MRILVAIGVAAATLAVAACATNPPTGSPAPSTSPSSTRSTGPTGAPSTSTPRAATHPVSAAAMPAAAPEAQAAAAMCAGNTAGQFVLVSVSKQRAWMCSKTTLVYTTPVTTGETVNGGDTPIGTWHVQAKQGARYLTTRDGASYHVEYWMPYDDIYGFHDSAWQTIPYGSQTYHTGGSHGCVHLPIAAMKWLFNWASVGAKVTVAT